MKDNALNFKVSSHLKNIIGKDLITDRYVAIYELVKNSLDAKATKVIIEIKSDYIIIKDNGLGMNLNDIENKWLFVGYSEKKDNAGAFAGSKGIGRFSSDTLGKTLTMKTRKKESSGIILTMDWNMFEVDQLDRIESIKLNYQLNDEMDYGTELKIIELRNKWDELQVKKLKDYLSKLKNPFEIKESVNIRLESEFHNLTGDIENHILEGLGDKSILLKVEIGKDRIKSILKHNGNLVSEFSYKNDTILKNINFELYHLTPWAKSDFTRKMGVPFTNYGNIFIYRNGYRVLPYGEVDYDIFKMNLRKSQGYNRYLGTRDLIGYISIQDAENKFKEATSRDGGFIVNEEYLGLEDIYMEYHKFLEDFMKVTAFNKLEAYQIEKNLIKRFLRKEDLVYEFGISKEMPDIKEVLHKIDKNIELTEADKQKLKDVEVLKKQDEKVLKEVKKDNRLLKKENVRFEKELTIKQKLINDIDDNSLKQDILEHHLNISVNEMASIMKRLKKTNNEFLKSEDFKKFEIEYYESLNKLKSLRNLIKGVEYDSRVATTNDIVQFIIEYSKKRSKQDNLKLTIYDNGIKYIKKYKAIMLIVILDNLFDNAISFKAETMQILVELNSELEVRFMTDTAEKINSNISKVLDYGYTTKKRGTGNGLFFVNKIIQDQFNGKAEVYTSGNQFVVALKIPI